MYYLLTDEKIKRLVSDLLGNNKYKVVCQSEDNKKFEEIKTSDKFYLNPDLTPTNVSIKEFFFPKSETLFNYINEKEGVKLIDPPSLENITVFFGVKPCDAAAIPVLGKVFNWDYKDEFFNDRVEKSIIIGLGCKYSDDDCFCTSVGLDPNSTKGSDLFLYPVNGGYILQCISTKGKSFLDQYSYLKENESEQFTGQKSEGPEKRFEYDNVKQWLNNNFKNAYWKEPAEFCVGCAKCAFVCPTCHCFDIVDEECGDCGQRLKNWDACQFELFTKHASGHNPRGAKENRYRQRVFHKFKYYKDNFDEILCTGCGRCIRGCPAFVDISGILSDISSFQEDSTTLINRN